MAEIPFSWSELPIILDVKETLCPMNLEKQMFCKGKIPKFKLFLFSNYNCNSNFLNYFNCNFNYIRNSRYLNEEFTLTLPNGKMIQDLKWFAVYDLTEYEAYGSLFIPEGFEPPGTQELSHLEGKSNDIEADRVLVLDSKTIMLEKFYYDGKGGNGVHFYAGRGPQPSPKGSVVPNELGYFEPLRRYYNEDVKISLPGDTTVADIRWFSVYDMDHQRDLGHVIVPEGINVPPSLSSVIEVGFTF